MNYPSVPDELRMQLSKYLIALSISSGWISFSIYLDYPSVSFPRLKRLPNDRFDLVFLMLFAMPLAPSEIGAIAEPGISTNYVRLISQMFCHSDVTSCFVKLR